jgi:hypothetical protein
VEIKQTNKGGGGESLVHTRWIGARGDLRRGTELETRDL